MTGRASWSSASPSERAMCSCSSGNEFPSRGMVSCLLPLLQICVSFSPSKHFPASQVLDWDHLGASINGSWSRALEGQCYMTALGTRPRVVQQKPFGSSVSEQVRTSSNEVPLLLLQPEPMNEFKTGPPRLSESLLQGLVRQAGTRHGVQLCPWGLESCLE